MSTVQSERTPKMPPMLHTLEVDTHRHVHEENNVLFPRAIDLEADRR
jgi:iron-sulfur cluster repair protein YtfE (RIC family)